MLEAEIGLRLDRIEAQLSAIGESQIGRSVPAEQVAEALQTIASNASRIAEGQAQASEARVQILEIVQWIRDRVNDCQLKQTALLWRYRTIGIRAVWRVYSRPAKHTNVLSSDPIGKSSETAG